MFRKRCTTRELPEERDGDGGIPWIFETWAISTSGARCDEIGTGAESSAASPDPLPETARARWHDRCQQP